MADESLRCVRCHTFHSDTVRCPDVMCSWCHGMNSRNGLDLTPYCIFCGHRANMPRSACDCPKCWTPVDGVEEPGTPLAELLAACKEALAQLDLAHASKNPDVAQAAIILGDAIAKAEGGR
jgi:hypothetical protein